MATRKIVVFSLATTVLMAQTAFAQNLGVLNNEQRPQNLISAAEIGELINSSTGSSGHSESLNNQDLRSDVYRRHGHGYGYGYGHHYHYPYYYYPYYYYPYYYYPYYYSSEPTHNPLSNGTRESTLAESSRLPVVCFASDTAGNWFANADVSTLAGSTQEAVNHECLANDSNCTVNLGCAVASPDR